MFQVCKYHMTLGMGNSVISELKGSIDQCIVPSFENYGDKSTCGMQLKSTMCAFFAYRHVTHTSLWVWCEQRATSFSHNMQAPLCSFVFCVKITLCLIPEETLAGLPVHTHIRACNVNKIIYMCVCVCIYTWWCWIKFWHTKSEFCKVYQM
jgi:hypothetical protein